MTITPITTRVYLGTSTVAAELVVNPGFETAGAGAPDVFGTWDESGVADETTKIHGGAHAAKTVVHDVLGLPVQGSVRQTIAVTALHLYHLSFWTLGDGDHDGECQVLDLTSGPVILTKRTGVRSSTVWEQVHVYFLTPTGCISISVRLRSPESAGHDLGDYAIFDDVSLEDLSDYTYAEMVDVLHQPGPSWNAGLGGVELTNRVAQIGRLQFVLDNSYANSTATPGLYSPGHASCMAAFVLGAPVKVTLDDGVAESVVFWGWITGIHPSPFLFEGPATLVDAEDWMGFAARQEMGVIPIATSQRADQALTTLLTAFKVQPPGGTDFDAGVETFDSVFDSDNALTFAASFFNKMALNEMGYIYLTPAGVLTFDNRDARPLNVTSAFTLSDAAEQPATALIVSYENAFAANVVQVSICPGILGTTAVVLWSLSGCPPIRAQETLDLFCSFTDPDTGSPIVAFDVEDPATVFEFGSIANFVSDNLHSFLSQDLEIGGNSLSAHLTNTGNQDGFLNDFQPKGKGIYRYSQVTVESRDETSIAVYGIRRFGIYLEQLTDIDKARNYAVYIRKALASGNVKAKRVSFIANTSAALAVVARTAKVSTLFTLIEAATGISEDFYINHITYSVAGPLLFVDLLAVPAAPHRTWIWDSSLWDNTAGEGWAL